MNNTAVIYYSNTGESRKIAVYVAQLLQVEAVDMLSLTRYDFDNVVIVFPVHCQNIPVELSPVFEKIRAKKVVAIATYGKMAYGRVLYECEKRYCWNIVAGVYLPTKHSYLPDDRPFEEYVKLEFVTDVFTNSQTVSIPKTPKNPLANLFPGSRSRLGVRLLTCRGCTGCGLCRTVCTNKVCIRCLKCVAACPQQARSFRLSLFMKCYLCKSKKDEFVLIR